MKPEVLIYNKEKIMYKKKKEWHFTEQAKNKISAYLAGWKDKYWEQMLRNSTLTFRSMNGIEYFENWFVKTNLLSYEIIKVKTKKITPAICDIVIKIEIEIDGKVESREYQVRLVQELEAYRASVNGVWGVNPPSSLRYLNRKDSYKVTVNKREKENKDA